MKLFRPVRGHREDDSDAALLRAVAGGDSAALATLYDRHAGWLHVRLTRRCADAEVVREVLQDTFVTVWRSAAGHRGGEAGGWLWTIAARRLVDARRAQERASRLETTPLDADSLEAPSTEERVLAGLEFGDVGTALDRISPESREVLRATVVDGLTTREAAGLLGIPEGTVKSRAMRARAELRTVLAHLHPSAQADPTMRTSRTAQPGPAPRPGPAAQANPAPRPGRTLGPGPGPSAFPRPGPGPGPRPGPGPGPGSGSGLRLGPTSHPTPAGGSA